MKDDIDDAELLNMMGTDARKWAQEFCKKFPNAPEEGTMLGWFANSIEAGKAAGRIELQLIEKI